jgi:hypothetical protein
MIVAVCTEMRSNDHGIWQRVLSACLQAWYQIPSETAHTAQLVRSLGSILSVDMAEEIFNAMPELCLVRDGAKPNPL